ncbi:MAG: phosphate acyltransferase PlsX [Clostridiales bacterium]|nr:phosphate acyltransferase PlsX [Clostridiales bacterium]
MRIIVDAFGGDNAPKEILLGCAMAHEEFGVDIILSGQPRLIEECAKENKIDTGAMEILPASQIMPVSAAPADILKKYKDSSMAVGLRALAQGQGQAFVSAGSTGALVMGATFIIKRIAGIKRTAIGSALPTNSRPVFLIDMGANADCKPEYLHQFALMGDIYMKKILNVECPRVALANIGTEDTKGDTLRLEAFDFMKRAGYNFIGNIEARDIPLGVCDVVVADGFTGNIILKMYEGVAAALMANIKGIFKKNLLTKLSALAVKDGLTDLKNRMDYTEFGGAPLMGVRAPVIKAHGSSNAKAIKNAIGQAKYFAERDLIKSISESL